MTRWSMVCALTLAAPGLCACSGDDDDDSSNQGHPATCQGLCSLSIGCPNDPEPDCRQTCEESTAECPSETAAFISCAVALPETDLECDAAGETDMKDTLCTAEKAAVAACR